MESNVLQPIIFTGSLDMDHDVKSIKPGDYIDALNFRNIFTENGIDGSGENISSNVNVPFGLPSGTNKCIGTYEDQQHNCAYYFIWNSNTNHTLLRYTPQQTGTGLIETVVNSPVLGFDEWTYINGVNVIGDLLYWNNPNSPQFKINVSKAVMTGKQINFKLCLGQPSGPFSVDYQFLSTLLTINIHFDYSGTSNTIAEAIQELYATLAADSDFVANFDFTNISDAYIDVTAKDTTFWAVSFVVSTPDQAVWYIPVNYYPVITLKTLDVGKYPSWCDPEFVFFKDPSRLENNITGSPYQFRVKYYYDDFEQSALSPISALGVGPNQLGDDMLSTQNNAIRIFYDDNGRLFSDRDIVRGVELFVRYSNTDQFKSFAYLYDYELSGQFIFYNDGAYTAIPDSESAKPYDNIPIESKTQEMVNNRLFYGNNLYGYNNESLNVNTEITWQPTSPTLYSVTGKILIRDIYTNDLQNFADSKVGGRWKCAQNGFTVYLAGTMFKAVTVQSGTDQNFTITGVPNGRYILRIANELVSDHSTLGNLFNSADTNLYWQQSSTFVRGTSLISGKREIVIEINNGNVTLTEDFIVDYLFTDPNDSSYPLTGFGYVMNHNTVYSDTIRQGETMEYANVSFEATYNKQYIVTQIDATISNQLDATIAGSSMPFIVGDVIKIESGTFFPPTSNTGTIIAIAGQVITYLNSGWVSPPTISALTNMVHVTSDDQNDSIDVTTDHNGYYYFKIENSQFVSDKNTTGNTNNGGFYQLSADTNYSQNITTVPVIQVQGGNPSKESGTFGLNRIKEFISDIVISITSLVVDEISDRQAMILGNTNGSITSTYRTSVVGKVVDQNGLGLDNIVVALTHTGRTSITNGDGEYAILAYAEDDNGSGTVRRINDFLEFGNKNIYTTVAYPNGNEIALSITPYATSGSPHYNATTPYIVDNLAVTAVFAPTSFPKHGGQYNIGIVYYDRLNRDNTVTVNAACRIKIPFYTEGNADYHNTPYVTIEIMHRPPVWATHYQIVRTKDNFYQTYLQLPINGVKYIIKYNEDGTTDDGTFGDPNVRFLEIDIKTLDYYANDFNGSVLGYTYSPGDRLKFIKKADGTFYDQYIDINVLGQDAFTIQLQYDILYPELTQGSLVEIYTPHRNVENQTYYEMSECYEIGNIGQSNRYHFGNQQDQSASDPVGVPAIITLANWDCYLRARNYTTFTATVPTLRPALVETYLLSDFTTQTAQSIGRVKAIVPTNRQVRRFTNTDFSNPYVPGTALNGLSSFELLSNDDLPTQYGELHKLVNNDNILLAVCTNKAYSIYVDKGILQGQDGSVTISVSSKVIGAFRELNGLYGTINPESFAQNEGLVFWWDAYRGVVCQYSNAGIEPVSRYNMNNFFATKGRLGIRADRTTYKVLGVIHKRFKEYIMAFNEISVDEVTYDAVTICYNYTANGWKTRYPYIPEAMCGIGINLLTFKNGQLYLHTQSTSKNTFFGVEYPTEVDFVVNEYPSTNKTFLSMSVEANGSPNFPVITTPVTEFNASGQESELLQTDFEFMNGSYWASFFKNKLTPNFLTEAEALIQGEELQAQTMSIKLSKDQNTLYWIKSAQVYLIMDNLTNS